LEARHEPVLVAETVAFLAPERGGVYVDATVGLGGHAAAILTAGPQAERVRLQQANFAQLGAALAELGTSGGLAGILADLGVSSLQLDAAERGFSFRRDGPLDMRMGLAEQTAADLVRETSEGDLERIFRDYGEERQARRIARAIVRERERSPIVTTGRLKAVIDSVKGHREREGRVDPATRVFQALRIAVNAELAGLERLLAEAVSLLAVDGRLVVISYHSLEDRIVKTSFRELARGEVDPVTGRTRSETQLIEVLTKKPVRPSEEEVQVNPRARSARLRAARRL
jgi:16S rRNA (cytosine1402-N4)-methyltransferase